MSVFSNFLHVYTDLVDACQRSVVRRLVTRA